MKRKLLFLVLAIAVCFSLASCSETADAPEGMQLVRGGEDVGYYFYAPEEWVVANMGNISATYVSTVDNTSVTFTEATKPQGTVAEYLDSMKSEFTYDEFEVSVNGEKCLFATADEAYKYVYSFKYAEYKFRCMQIFSVVGERFYIFTYTALDMDRGDGTTTYGYYLEGKIQSIIDNFKFTDKKDTSVTEYEKDEDGYILVSDKKVSGFDLYVPDTATPEYSGGIVSVKLGEGANITLSKATSTGVSVDQYVNMRKEELSAIVSDFEFVVFEDDKIYTPNTQLGDSTQKFAYEYTYTYAGESYHVYQILAVSGTNGYVFTYTATADAYDDLLQTAKNIAKKVKF